MRGVGTRFRCGGRGRRVCVWWREGCVWWRERWWGWGRTERAKGRKEAAGHPPPLRDGRTERRKHYEQFLRALRNSAGGAEGNLPAMASENNYLGIGAAGPQWGSPCQCGGWWAQQWAQRVGSPGLRGGGVSEVFGASIEMWKWFLAWTSGLSGPKGIGCNAEAFQCLHQDLDSAGFFWQAAPPPVVGAIRAHLVLGPFLHNEGLVWPLSSIVANLTESNPGCLGYIGDYTTQLCGQ